MGTKRRRESFARRARVSPSRFAHLFKEQLGLPFSRYMLWRKLTRAMLAIGSERTIADAAHCRRFCRCGAPDADVLSNGWHGPIGPDARFFCRNRVTLQRFRAGGEVNQPRRIAQSKHFASEESPYFSALRGRAHFHLGHADCIRVSEPSQVPSSLFLVAGENFAPSRSRLGNALILRCQPIHSPRIAAPFNT